MAAARNARRLCVILVADVAGYSRLMGADENGTLAALTAHRCELIDPAVADHAGRIVKTTGDGFFVEFASAVDAVSCAIDMQHGMGERNRIVPHDRRLAFRIGLNLGDVIVQNGDLYGDGVNVAARLEGLAEPGGICLSASAHEQVQDKIAAVWFEHLGEQRVKNIARPVRVYRVALGLARSLPLPVPALPNSPSIAVLPLDNLSADPEQEYFVDGAGRGPDHRSREDRRPTGHRAQLDLHLQGPRSKRRPGRSRAGGPLRRRRQRAEDRQSGAHRGPADRCRDEHAWADRYDRDLTDIFAVQDEITREIVGALRLRLIPDGEPRSCRDRARFWTETQGKFKVV
jgi:adenylate cyclase